MSATLLPKQQLKNYCRRNKYQPPYYLLIGEEKVDLHKYYTVQISIKDVLITEGRGLSRRIAEFKAALNALNLIGQSDPSVYDSNIKPKYGKYSLGRSFSVDHISRANRSDSIPSMISYSPGQYSSACPSIEGIESMTETCDSAYGSETQNGYDTLRKDDDVFFQKLTIVEQDQQSSSLASTKLNGNHNEEEDTELSESFDEGVCIESNESSSPNSSSPSTSARSSSAAEQATNKISKSSLLPNYQTLAQSNGSPTIDQLQQPESDQQTKSKSSSSFLRSFFLLRSLRAIHRRSFRRKSSSLSDKSKPSNNSSNSTKAQLSFDDPSTSTSNSNQIQPRPTSSSSTSSAFSSSSSITSSSQSSSTSASSTSGSFTLEEPLTVRLVPEDNHSPLTNGYSNLITQSIIEEDEEEEEDDQEPIVNKSVDQLDHYINKAEKELDKYHSFSRAQSNRSIPRSLSTSYGLSVSNLCSHNHFSIYGPMLCSNTNHGSMKSVTIKETPTAVLLRYCVRMYLPIPYYDIHYDDIFYVTCRVLISTSRSEKDKLPVILPAKYKDREFTAKGNGQTLPKARNMAAEIIIEKLKNAQIYIE